MFKQSHPRYIKALDGTSLYVCTNFHPDNHDSEEVVMVFNYGLVCNNAHWENQISYFEHQGYKLLIHNYRGHFNSHGANNIEAITFDTIVDDLKTICDQLAIKKAIMFGHSMGVNITLEFTKQFPSMVAAEILIAGTIFPPHDVMFDSQSMNVIFPLISILQKKFPDIYQFVWPKRGPQPPALLSHSPRGVSYARDISGGSADLSQPHGKTPAKTLYPPARRDEGPRYYCSLRGH